MLRISEENLIQENGLYYYNDQPYYGYSYQFNDEGVFHAVYKVINGKKVDLLVVEGIADPGDLIVSSDYLVDTGNVDEENFPIYRFRERLFEGVSYMFNSDGYLIRLSYFDDGEEHPFITYYLSGLLKSEKMLLEDYEWYEDGQLKKKQVRSNTNNYIFSLRLNKYGKMHWLSLKKEYKDIKELELISLDNSVNLFNPGINDKIFQDLSKKQTYSSIQELSLTQTDITGSTLLNLMHNNIHTLELDDNFLITQSDADKIKESFLSCHVIFSSKEKD